MKSFVQFLQTSMKAITDISPFPISVTDETGRIIGDSNPERIGTYHEPSADVLQRDIPQIFEKAAVSTMENVLPGVAVPLYFDNERKGVLGLVGEPDEVLPYARLMKQHVEMVWQDTVRQRIDDLESAILDAFIQYILSAEELDGEKVVQYCDMLEINPTLKRYCIVIDLRDTLLRRMQEHHHMSATAHFRKILLDSVDAVFGKTPEDLSAFLNTEKIILIKAVTSDDIYWKELDLFREKGTQLLKLLAAHDVKKVSMAAGALSDGLDDLARSYHEAERLIEYGRDHGIQPEIYSYQQWDILVSMLPDRLDDGYKQKLSERFAALYRDKQFPDLAASFEEYCHHNLNISKTAAALFIHRNTLIYRLKKIETITQLNLTRFEHCTLLWIALKT
ncbi:uncharacterized protein JNUCC1_01036 [Lentibacillus sp. JNUCC-1]|uniref:sugar diacid recognition domain-containing protein n=1 Tax=Lentibacillus sp. JNUCC-1 TaxID=2654513 RepID=UPI00132CB2DB|nr:sugar diacid recognition domain-containing protein [Lentibacillus sp. JNUCC-1]MUV37230.1 uncharacterized protein [Lentibacillus sp. JNUCC-1]